VWLYESTTCLTNVLTCAGRVNPHRIRRAHQPDSAWSFPQQIERYARFAHFTWSGSTSLPLALKTSAFALAGSIPTEFGELINLTYLDLEGNRLSGMPALLTYLVWSTSRTPALKTSSFALAGSIPTEFGELIKLTYLNLDLNKLSGTPFLFILPGVVVRVYHLHTTNCQSWWWWSWWWRRQCRWCCEWRCKS
jgi:hypothetical protein